MSSDIKHKAKSICSLCSIFKVGFYPRKRFHNLFESFRKVRIDSINFISVVTIFKNEIIKTHSICVEIIISEGYNFTM